MSGFQFGSFSVEHRSAVSETESASVFSFATHQPTTGPTNQAFTFTPATTTISLFSAPQDQSLSTQLMEHLEHQRQILDAQQRICNLTMTLFFATDADLEQTPHLKSKIEWLYGQLVAAKMERNELLKDHCSPTMFRSLVSK